MTDKFNIRASNEAGLVTRNANSKAKMIPRQDSDDFIDDTVAKRAKQPA